MGLNKRQKDFCKFIVQGFSNVESALKAGYARTTAQTKAHLWLEKSEIKAEIEKLRSKVQKIAEEEFNYTIEQSFKKLNEIQELALQPNKKGDYFNLATAVKAEELKGKMYGVYKEDNKQKNTVLNLVDAATKIKKALE